MNRQSLSKLPRKVFNKLVNFVSKALLNMDFLQTFIHDPVVHASASTYNLAELARLGLQIDKNLSTSKVRSVGGIYPDIVIWKPDYLGANSGQALLVEIIETSIPLAPDVNKWVTLCNIGIRVNIVVNPSQKDTAESIISQYGLKNCYLQTYKYDVEQKRYIFYRT